MKQQKSRRKDNCQAVFKHLKHVVNVRHRQKPYLDYSCEVVVSFSFFCNLKKCYLQVRLRDSDCANVTVAKDKRNSKKRGGKKKAFISLSGSFAAQPLC